MVLAVIGAKLVGSDVELQSDEDSWNVNSLLQCAEFCLLPYYSVCFTFDIYSCQFHY